jgi:probable HAF family extracellular repeat protein
MSKQTPRSRRRFTQFVSVVAFVVACGLVALADSSRLLMINDIGQLPNGDVSVAYGINAQGTVVGYARPCPSSECSVFHAALYGSGRLVDLGTLGGTWAQANAINSLSHIVGASETAAPGHPMHAFLISTGGSMTDLGTLGGPNSIAYSINSRDVIAGAAMTPNGQYQAVVFQNGTVTGLGTLGAQSWARGINSSGQIVGWSELTLNGITHAFIYENGAMRDLGTFGADSSLATAINDVGQITGQRCFGGLAPTSCRAFRYDNRTGRLTDIQSLGGPFSQGFGINSAGDVVGVSQLTGGTQAAFLFRNGTSYYLNLLVPMDDSWNFISAEAINDAGQIAGLGKGPAGVLRGYVLTPTISSAWANRDIGPTGITGSAVRSIDGPFTVRGAGLDIWDTADSFHLVHKPLAFNVDGQIIARVDSLTNTGQFAKAGVMIRQTEATDSSHVILDIKPDGGVEFMQRDSIGAPTHFIAGAFAPPPYWLRLARDGSTVTGSISPDGRTWTGVGSTMITAEPETLDYALAVTSHDRSQLNTAIFSGVSLLPAHWANQDVGVTNRMGSTSVMGSRFSIEAAGRDIWDTTDSFHFVHQPHAGDGEIVAQVLSVPNTHQFAKAGVMMRDGLSTGAAHVILDVKPDGNVEFMQRRTAAGETAYMAGGRASWVKLRRSGNTVTGYISTNGTTWTMIGWTAVDFPSSVSYGLAVTSHDNNRLGAAEIESVAINP